jgi:uncharacterized protein involved in response to NO
MSPPELFQLDPKTAPPPPYPVILAKGFRILFFAAGLAAMLLLSLWLLIFTGKLDLATRLGGAAWHGHEMLYGYAFAVIAGFLLTAVYNWVGKPHLSGWKLGALAGLWALGRLIMLCSDALPVWLVGIVDIAFLPVLTAVLAPPLIKAKNWPNLGFMGLLLLASAYYLAFHLDKAGIVDLGGSLSLLTASVEILVVFVVVLTGRVMVMFTENGIPGTKTRKIKWVEFLALPSAGAFVIFDLLPFAWASIVASLLAFVAAFIHALRLSGWQSQRTLKTPLVWVLHAGYALLIAALVAKGLANLGHLPPSVALHAFTVATLGPITLGMMSRIGLGHTGRMIKVPPHMAAAFALVIAAGLIRAAAPLTSAFYMEMVLLSGLGWTAAFALFTFSYFPVLSSPRVDGQAG